MGIITSVINLAADLFGSAMSLVDEATTSCYDSRDSETDRMAKRCALGIIADLERDIKALKEGAASYEQAKELAEKVARRTRVKNALDLFTRLCREQQNLLRALSKDGMSEEEQKNTLSTYQQVLSEKAVAEKGCYDNK